MSSASQASARSLAEPGGLGGQVAGLPLGRRWKIFPTLFRVLVQDQAGWFLRHGGSRQRHETGTSRRIDVDGAKLDMRNHQILSSANTKRRNMTKGQTAMIAVEGGLISTDQSKGGIRGAAASVGVAFGTFHKALFVKEHAPDLVEEVINSTLSLDEAHSNLKWAPELHRACEARTRVASLDTGRGRWRVRGQGV